MSRNGQCFVEWKEEFVSQERGNRVVHYFLKNSAGESVLAVVGTERSVRHMFYVIADEFLEAHGKENSIHSGFKWRSRREVVDWLTSMLSKQSHYHGDRSDVYDSAQALGFPEYTQDGMGRFVKNFKGRGSDIVWSGSPWLCGKHLKHFPTFCRNGITIPIQSFVFVMAKGENHYVAYLEDMYEDKRGQKKVKVRWFHHNREVKGVVPLRNPHPKEVFITPYAQVISAECVDGLATVLNQEHYEKCLAAIPHGFLVKVHVCYRQFRNNRIKPFDLSKLRGYFDQPILSCLGPDSFSYQRPESCNDSEGEAEEIEGEEHVKRVAKRVRSAGDHCPSRGKTSGKARRVNLSDGSSFKNGLYSLKRSMSRPWFSEVFKVDDEVELLCQDSGIRGCWFRCTVLQVSKKQMKVQYKDLRDEDGPGNLEEWIPVFKPAMPDKLGMRQPNRPTIRPVPIKDQTTELAIQVGAAIDAWWSDGWWEGIVTSIDCSADNVQVFFPGESLLLGIEKKDLRVGREWLGDRWIDIEAKPDVVSIIPVPPVSSSGTKPSMSASSIEKDLDGCNKLVITEDENQNLNNSDDPPKAMELINRNESSDNVDSVDSLKSNDDNVDDVGKDDEECNVGKDDEERNVVKDGNGSEGNVMKVETEISGQSCKAAEMTTATEVVAQ